jgi:diguanylate cyclase (GGDEF)-like protein
LLAVIAFAGWSANKTATEFERTLLENALNQSIANVLNGQKSIAWWDDAVVKITDQSIDYQFADDEFGLFLTETYGHDEVYILGEHDQPIYTYKGGERGDPSAYEARRASLAPVVAEARGLGGSKLKARPDEFGRAQTNYKVLSRAVQVAHWAGHIISVDGKPAVVAAITIVPNVDMDLLKGTPRLLVSVVYINEEFIAKIARILLLEDLKLTAEPATDGRTMSEAFLGDGGTRLGYLSWTARRPGQILLTIILPLVACGVVGSGFLSSQMFRRLRRASEELAQREARARHASKHDALSGLPNRQHMIEKVDEWLTACEPASAGQRVIAAYIDVDRFKDINDTLGHETGDKLIKAVAQRLRTRLRPDDFLARFGGDEFAILCLADDTRGGGRLADRIATAFEQPIAIDGQKLRVTASVGIAMAPDHGRSADDLMRHADIALYEAKNLGRDRAVFFTSAMAKEVETRRAIEVDLRAAIDRDELRVHYQPIISCRTGQIVGAEALMRWRHPLRGELSPADFIPIAENSGLMPALGTWLLGRVMEDAKRWPDLEIAVNLSPVQFRQSDLEALLRRLSDEHGVQPSRFVLEITEGVLMEASDFTKSTLKNLQTMGFKTALDDFGTGYSSLSYLCNFKFDKIKIDRSFVTNMSKALASRTIIQSVVSLGRGLGMQIVAEGVETEYEALMMAHFGCTELQGFYYSRPVEASQLTQLIEKFEPRSISTITEPLPLEPPSSATA